MFLRTLAMAAAVATLAIPVATLAAEQGHETVRPIFRHAIPNIPGKSLVSVLVDYPPGAKSAAHTHAKSAFIYAQVLSGAVRSQVDDGPAKVYRAGETFFEPPGAHHAVSENASTTEPAQLLAVFVIDTDESALTTPDPH